MPSWLETSLNRIPLEASVQTLVWRIGMALVLGVVVAALYGWARREQIVASTFLATLVMLSTLMAMATQVIGDNAARAFGLVGALSVVRFRTVVKDTQDTAFVIFAVIVGMAAGANEIVVALVGLIVLGLASLWIWPSNRRDGWHSSEARLTLRTGMDDMTRSAVAAILQTAAERSDLIEVATAKQGAMIETTYRLQLRPGTSPSSIVTELKAIAGVDNVSLSRED
jgi:hypothetical protein